MKRLICLLALLPSFALATETVAYGEWIKGRRFDYRYVTTYKVETVQRPFTNFPWIEQDCHDEGNRFANWTKSVSYEITYSGKISLAYLGLGIELGGERTRTVEYSFQRWVQAERGIRARHTLHEQFENWTGISKKEYRYADGSTELGEKEYPFKLTNLNFGLFVKRDVFERCE